MRIFEKNETLKMWILWKMRFWKCEFLDKLRFVPKCALSSTKNIAKIARFILHGFQSFKIKQCNYKAKKTFEMVYHLLDFLLSDYFLLLRVLIKSVTCQSYLRVSTRFWNMARTGDRHFEGIYMKPFFISVGQKPDKIVFL